MICYRDIYCSSNNSLVDFYLTDAFDHKIYGGPYLPFIDTVTYFLVILEQLRNSVDATYFIWELTLCYLILTCLTFISKTLHNIVIICEKILTWWTSYLKKLFSVIKFTQRKRKTVIIISKIYYKMDSPLPLCFPVIPTIVIKYQMTCMPIFKFNIFNFVVK